MQLPTLEVLSNSEISQIHEASLRVLSETGIVVGSAKALKLLAQAVARVDFQKKLVKIPPRLVEETLTSLPSEITLYNTRSKQPAFTLDGASSHMVAGRDALFFLNDMGQLKDSGNIIVNLRAMAFQPIRDDLLAYGAAKRAVVHIILSMAGVFGQYNIRVNGIAPGYADTERPRKFYERMPQIRADIGKHNIIKPVFQPKFNS